MISFISPAMGFHTGLPETHNKPAHLEKTKFLVSELQKLSPQEIMDYMQVSEQIAEVTFMRYLSFSFDYGFEAAKLFDGIAYKALRAKDFDDESFAFFDKHTRILSGLYGCLKPSDSIMPYRLEMKQKIAFPPVKNLYHFWGKDLYDLLVKDSDGIIVNLASKEYSKCIEPYCKDQIFVTCTFMTDKGKGFRTYATEAKRARGLMARYIAENKIDSLEDLKEFNAEGYLFKEHVSKTDSNKMEFVFIKNKL